MSKKIEEILEVVEEVRDNYRNRKDDSTITEMRINAGHSVAHRRNIKNQTVISKFIIQLRPHIKKASEFDAFLESWLLNDSDELKEILLKNKSDSHDEILIKNAFYKSTEQDILLSEEFGFDPNEQEFKEGKEKFQIHLTRERNRNLVKLAKDKWLKEQNGNIHCKACSFSFSETYGEIGEGYIEAHHTFPIYSLFQDTIVKIRDLVPICSNCHSIMHRSRPLLSINQLKNVIRN